MSNSKSVTLYDVQGKFNDFEPLTFNGVASGFVGVAVTEFGISDVKSVHGVVGWYTFNGDTIQSPISVVGVAQFLLHLVLQVLARSEAPIQGSQLASKKIIL